MAPLALATTSAQNAQDIFQTKTIMYYSKRIPLKAQLIYKYANAHCKQGPQLMPMFIQSQGPVQSLPQRSRSAAPSRFARLESLRQFDTEVPHGPLIITRAITLQERPQKSTKSVTFSFEKDADDEGQQKRPKSVSFYRTYNTQDLKVVGQANSKTYQRPQSATVRYQQQPALSTREKTRPRSAKPMGHTLDDFEIFENF